MPKLTCPHCKSTSVEKIPLGSIIGKSLLKGIKKKKKNPIALYQLSKLESMDNKAVFIYNCISCGNYEIWDVKKRKQLFKRESGRNFVNRAVQRREMISGVLISLAIIASALSLIIYFDINGEFMIEVNSIIRTLHFLPFTSFDLGVFLTIVFLTSIYFLIIVGVSYTILKVIDKKISFLQFNFKLHDFMYEKHLYFLEFHTKEEKINFGASFKRAVFGTMLVLGIAVLVIENFLTIESLKQYFFVASAITLVSLAISLPFIVIFLYISPLITKEINLYYYNKNDRVVKNVGSWLENSLQFFAVIDIILTFAIMLDSDLDPAWFGLILALVLLLFTFFFIFTIIFNRYFHFRLKEKFREFIMGNNHLPIRKIGTFQQKYYCWSCGAETDYVQLDACSNCGAEIHKCCICNEIIDIDKPVKQNGNNMKSKKGVIDSLIGKMETRMSVGPGTELPYIECPHCNSRGHIDEFLSWLKMRKTCPVCKTRLEYNDII
ncbi:MAG: hypothetical protein ACTSU9_08790 [Promethearchaeota archaeon]